MKLSFAKPGAPAPQPVSEAAPIDVQATVVPTPVAGVEVETQTTAAPAPAPASQLPAVQAPAHVAAPNRAFDDGGDIETGDIIIPRLNIVQRVGELSAQFPPETILLNQETPLAKPVSLVVLGFRPKLYVERVQGTSPGDFCRTTQEVVAKGGTTDYQEAERLGKPWYQPMATAVVLIRKSAEDKDEDAFPLSDGKNRYAVALWSMKGSAYTRAAKKIFTARTSFGHLSQGYTFAEWKLTAAVESFRNGNVAVVPVLSRGDQTTPEFREWAASLFPPAK